MKNVFKKMLLASAVALAALGTLVAQPAQAQTPTPTPQWKVKVDALPSATTPYNKFAWNYDPFQAAIGTSPISYINDGYNLNGSFIDFLVDAHLGDGVTGVTYTPVNDAWRTDVDYQATFLWDGASGDCPNTIDVKETLLAQALVGFKPKGAHPTDYGTAIVYEASFSGLPTGTSVTTTTGPISKSAQAQFTTTYTVDKSSWPYKVILPIRHAHSNLLIDYSLEPSIPSNQRPGSCDSHTEYTAFLDPFYPTP